MSHLTVDSKTWFTPSPPKRQSWRTAAHPRRQEPKKKIPTLKFWAGGPQGEQPTLRFLGAAFTPTSQVRHFFLGGLAASPPLAYFMQRVMPVRPCLAQLLRYTVASPVCSSALRSGSASAAPRGQGSGRRWASPGRKPLPKAAPESRPGSRPGSRCGRYTLFQGFPGSRTILFQENNFSFLEIKLSGFQETLGKVCIFHTGFQAGFQGLRPQRRQDSGQGRPSRTRPGRARRELSWLVAGCTPLVSLGPKTISQASRRHAYGW